MAKKILNIGENVYTITFDEFEEDIELEQLLKIDYSNIIGEMVTFPIVVAKLGNMLADAESKVSEKKLNLDVLEAKLKEEYRLQYAEQNNGKNPTVDALNSSVLLDKRYQVFNKNLITAKKVRDYLLTIYLAAKDKSEKINRVFYQAHPNDIPDGVIEGRVNSSIVKKNKHNKLIQ
jgi:hypothetical protein